MSFLFFSIYRNSIPPTTTVENLLVKEKAAKGKLHVDVGFWGGIIPGNEKQLKPLLGHGVVGFKCFLCPSGVDEFPNVDKHHIDLAYHELKDSNALIAVCILILIRSFAMDKILIFSPFFLDFCSFMRKFAEEPVIRPVIFPIFSVMQIKRNTKHF